MASHVHPGAMDASESAGRPDRGREADRPSDISGRGWLDVAMRVKNEVARDNVSLIAAGLALYALLAVFPGLAAAVSIYGLFASPEQIAGHMQAFEGVLPTEAAGILEQQLQSLSGRQQTLGVGLVVSLLLALWSARKGMVALMTATNVAYDEREERGFFKQIFVSLAFTLGAVFGFLAVLVLAVAVPLALGLLPIGRAAEIVIAIVNWSLLWLIAILGMSVVYRFAPDRREAKWRWLTWGSGIAATFWFIGSLLFALYAQKSASIGQTYGALGGVVVLLLWFYLTGYALVLGAEINSEMERQTKKDTTEGPSHPMGERGAYAADTVGPAWKEQNEQ